MSNFKKASPRQPDAVEATAAGDPPTEASTEQLGAEKEGDRPTEAAEPAPAPAAAAESPQALDGAPGTVPRAPLLDPLAQHLALFDQRIDPLLYGRRPGGGR